MLAKLALPGHPSLISSERFRNESRLSARALERAILAKRLFAVDLHGREYIPNFFLDRRYDRLQLQAICKVLGDLPGGSKLQFFTTPKASLSGQTPLQALMDRRAAAVRRTAQGFVER